MKSVKKWTTICHPKLVTSKNEQRLLPFVNNFHNMNVPSISRGLSYMFIQMKHIYGIENMDKIMKDSKTWYCPFCDQFYDINDLFCSHDRFESKDKDLSEAIGNSCESIVRAIDSCQISRDIHYEIIVSPEKTFYRESVEKYVAFSTYVGDLSHEHSLSCGYIHFSRYNTSFKLTNLNEI